MEPAEPARVLRPTVATQRRNDAHKSAMMRNQQQLQGPEMYIYPAGSPNQQAVSRYGSYPAHQQIDPSFIEAAGTSLAQRNEKPQGPLYTQVGLHSQKALPPFLGFRPTGYKSSINHNRPQGTLPSQYRNYQQDRAHLGVSPLTSSHSGTKNTSSMEASPHKLHQPIAYPRFLPSPILRAQAEEAGCRAYLQKISGASCTIGQNHSIRALADDMKLPNAGIMESSPYHSSQGNEQSPQQGACAVGHSQDRQISANIQLQNPHTNSDLTPSTSNGRLPHLNKSYRPLAINLPSFSDSSNLPKSMEEKLELNITLWAPSADGVGRFVRSVKEFFTGPLNLGGWNVILGAGMPGQRSAPPNSLVIEYWSPQLYTPQMFSGNALNEVEAGLIAPSQQHHPTSSYESASPYPSAKGNAIPAFTIYQPSFDGDFFIAAVENHKFSEPLDVTDWHLFVGEKVTAPPGSHVEEYFQPLFLFTGERFIGHAVNEAHFWPNGGHCGNATSPAFNGTEHKQTVHNFEAAEVIDLDDTDALLAFTSPRQVVTFPI